MELHLSDLLRAEGDTQHRTRLPRDRCIQNTHNRQKQVFVKFFIFILHLYLSISFRIRINGVGVFDVISYESDKDPSHFQREDLLSLGKLILSLACKSPTAVNNVNDSLEYIGNQYSIDLKNLVVPISFLRGGGKTKLSKMYFLT